MTQRTPRTGDIVDAWTAAEQDVWSSWSGIGQDLTHSDTTPGCTQVLEALESTAQHMARLQSVAVRSVCASVEANPFIPPPARGLATRICQPLQSVTDWQQHLVSAWFGMARQLAILSPTSGRSVAPRETTRRGGAF